MGISYDKRRLKFLIEYQTYLYRRNRGREVLKGRVALSLLKVRAGYK